MPAITIRKISQEDKRALRIRAAHNNRSMEEEARQILHLALSETPATVPLGTAIRNILKAHDLDGIDIPEVSRNEFARNPFEE